MDLIFSEDGLDYSKQVAFFCMRESRRSLTCSTVYYNINFTRLSYILKINFMRNCAIIRDFQRYKHKHV